MSIADELTKLADLHEKGLLTAEEFATQKAGLLGSTAPAAAGAAAAAAARPQPMMATVDPEKERKAKTLVMWSHVLGWGGILFMFLVGPAIGVTSNNWVLGGTLIVLGLVGAIAGAIVGQIGRAMQGRII